MRSVWSPSTMNDLVVHLMLDKRCRRWANIISTFVQCFGLDGCWALKKVRNNCSRSHQGKHQLILFPWSHVQSVIFVDFIKCYWPFPDAQSVRFWPFCTGILFGLDDVCCAVLSILKGFEDYPYFLIKILTLFSKIFVIFSSVTLFMTRIPMLFIISNWKYLFHIIHILWVLSMILRTYTAHPRHCYFAC